MTTIGKQKVVIAKVLKRRSLRIQALQKLKQKSSIAVSQFPASPKSLQTVGLLSSDDRSVMPGALGCNNDSLEEDKKAIDFGSG